MEIKYKKNMIETVTITGMTSEGSGVAHLQNSMVVFTPLTAVGDVVEIRLVQVKKSFAYGKIEKIISPSKDRIENDCPHFGVCGGCSYRHINYKSELELKKNHVDANLLKIGGINIKTEEIMPSPIIEGYRNKGTFPIRMNPDGSIAIGFFSKRSHRLIDVEYCRLHPEFFKEIIKVIKLFIENEKITVYNEESKKGLLRHLYIRYGESFNEVMVCLVINGDNLPKKDIYLSMLKSLDINIHSVMLNINKTKSNIILGKKNILISGRNYIRDTLCNLDFILSPNTFYQVNTKAAENLYNTAIEYADLKKDDVILDLYCGAGTIGLSMARFVKKIFGVEIVIDAVIDAHKNASINNIKNADFIAADVSTIHQSIKNLNPTTIILDPPRKGSDKSTLKMIAALAPKKIIMISCNSATLARDLKFLDLLNYKATKAKSVDMFPRTTHVESVVLLEKV